MSKQETNKTPTNIDTPSYQENSMVKLDPPAGFTGYILAPDPDTWLTARQMNTYLRRQNRLPPDFRFRETRLVIHMYCMAPLCEFHLQDENGQDYLLDDDRLLTLEYPGQLAYIIWQATYDLVEQAQNEKN